MSEPAKETGEPTATTQSVTPTQSKTNGEEDVPDFEVGIDGENPVSPNNPPVKAVPRELRDKTVAMGPRPLDPDAEHPPTESEPARTPRDSLAVEHVDEMTYQEVRAALKDRGLPVDGDMATLKDRLREHLRVAQST